MINEDDRDTDTGIDTDVSKMGLANKPVAKPKVVTKEELAASGLSLRDYMNKQQGLTRRGSSAPAIKAEPESESSGVTRMSKEAGEAARTKFREEATPDVTKMSIADRSKLTRERARSGSSSATDTRSVNERIRSTLGMKAGGKVSSASSRGDGIATKGKTRGRLC
jgi:hypothetical protein